MIVVWTRTMKRVKRDCQAWTRAKFARIERSRNCLCLGGILLSWLHLLVVRELEWNPLQPRTPPPKSTGLFVFLATC